jgi:predicted membrane-bound spermidine synthase
VRRWGFPALAFVTGAAVTVYEFAAPSLFRGWFGQTIYVWANVIGVILFALALGYAAGGRLADRTTTLVPLALVLAFAGTYGLVVGWAGPAVCGWLAGPEEYTQDAAVRAFVAESLAASLFLFGPPLMALGMATPLLVQRASAAWPVGRAAGLIFAVGTGGSIAGIYATTFLFVDWWGVRATITVASCVLVVLGALGLLAARRRRAAAAVLVPLALAPFGVEPPWDALPPEGARLVAFRESPYQLVRVVDRPARDGGGRWLAFDEGLGTYHSMRIDDKGWTGAYYDAFAAIPDWLPGEGPLKVLILGNAAGTMSRFLQIHKGARAIEIDGVEIDPQVTEVSRETMGLKDEDHRRIVHADGRAFLRGCAEGSYDAIFLDAYARQVSIPPALATREFFGLARSRLREGGLLVCNIGALRPGGELVRTLADTAAAGFGSDVALAPLEDLANVLLVAARGGPPPAPPSHIQLGAFDSFARHVPGTGTVLTDDFCPVEAITARDLELRE